MLYIVILSLSLQNKNFEIVVHISNEPGFIFGAQMNIIYLSLLIFSISEVLFWRKKIEWKSEEKREDYQISINLNFFVT